MRQKPGPRPKSPTVDTPATSASLPVDRSANNPILPAPDSIPDHLPVDSPSSPKRPRLDEPGSSRPQTSPIEVSVVPRSRADTPTFSITSLEDFAHPYFGDLPEPNESGIRRYLAKDWVDVHPPGTEGRHHVCVQYDADLKAYRVMSFRRLAPGPPIYRTTQGNLWSLDRHLTLLNGDDYAFSETPDADGYYAFRALGSSSDAAILGYAIKHPEHHWVAIDPARAKDKRSAVAQWSDQDIQRMYIVDEVRISDFRTHAQASGKAPEWAPRVQNTEDALFVADSLKWLHPQMSLAQRLELQRSYNLTKDQLCRLRTESGDGQIPEWAEQHKRLTLDSNNVQRFNLIGEELEHYVRDLRSQGLALDHHWPATRYSDVFLADYAAHLGYLRSKHDMLYRTDIPAMFRGETRLPFELARDGRMMYRKGNPTGTTNKRALSATFGLHDATAYAATKGGFYHELHYNSQANRFPGVNPQRSKGQTGESSDSGSSVSEGKRTGDEGDSDSSFVFDDSKGYESTRRKQTTSFVYAIDTRGLEVVPGAENKAFNPANGKFLFDDLEGHISTPTRGISAERIWLVRSDLTRAARVKDVLEQAGDRVAALEQATWAGTDSRAAGNFASNAYDSLIDEIAGSGGLILELPKGDKTFADDIVWPVPEHDRS
ncbi:hypothetical protein [Pseudomonas fluorescens]|uniref:Uncharacterized protein n=1 Tax=Pseudomonas fluorescens TaxID=294 RepID=A0A5E6TH94_PSEFL|nr:hypothetical protein [Pseudomonas fluorescens]VVM87308.1 hypothetical protein PS655_02630 [Pseudomonas fluorescens]